MPKSEISSVSLQQLTQSEKTSKNFSVQELYKKRLNAGDDITNDFIQDGSKIKTLTGGGTLNAPQKGKSDISFSNYAKLIFACNDLPEYRDTSKGWNRRPYILTMKTINDFKMRYDMEQIFKQRGSFILYCIQEFKKQLNSQLKQGIANPRLYEDAETIKNRKEWLIFNDPVQQFIDEKIVPRNDLPDQGKHTLRNCRKVKETYNAYVSWCKESNYQPLNSKSFSKAMKQKGYENRRTTITGQTAYWWYDLKLYSDTGSIPQQENNLHTV
jgi:putative DNA primase/helicase